MFTAVFSTLLFTAVCHCYFTAGVALSTVLTALYSVCHCYFTAGVALSTVLTALYSVCHCCFTLSTPSVIVTLQCFYCVDRSILRVSLLLYVVALSTVLTALYSVCHCCVDRFILRVSLQQV